MGDAAQADVCRCVAHGGDQSKGNRRNHRRAGRRVEFLICGSGWLGVFHFLGANANRSARERAREASRSPLREF